MEARRFESSEAQNFPKLEDVANMLQLRLMPIAFRALYPDQEVDMSNREVRNVVAEVWVNKYSQMFRDYIEDNPHEQVNIHDEGALIEFFEKMSPNDTIH